jgi:hypothetical protein
MKLEFQITPEKRVSNLVDYIGRTLQIPDTAQYTLVVKGPGRRSFLCLLISFSIDTPLLPTSFNIWLERTRSLEAQTSPTQIEFVWARQTYWIKGPPRALYLEYLTVCRPTVVSLTLSSVSGMSYLVLTASVAIKRLCSPACSSLQISVLPPTRP